MNDEQSTEVAAATDQQGRLDAIVMRNEAKTLAAYHEAEGDYAQDCYATQKRIANSNPIHTSPDHKTKEDWLNSAAEWEKRRAHHLDRGRYWRKFLDA